MIIITIIRLLPRIKLTSCLVYFWSILNFEAMFGIMCITKDIILLFRKFVIKIERWTWCKPLTLLVNKPVVAHVFELMGRKSLNSRKCILCVIDFWIFVRVSWFYKYLGYPKISFEIWYTKTYVYVISCKF